MANVARILCPDIMTKLGITQTNRDSVTVALTLPLGGIPFGDLVEAVKNAAMAHGKMGNYAAAQTLQALYCLAERGRVSFEFQDHGPPVI